MCCVHGVTSKMSGIKKCLTDDELIGLLEASDDEYVGGFSSSSEEDNVENIEEVSSSSEIGESDQNIMSEDEDIFASGSLSEDEIPLVLRVAPYKGKNGIIWYKQPPYTKGRTPARNVITERPGVKQVAKYAKTNVQAWSLLFTDEMISLIVKYTNIQIDMKRPQYSRERDATETNEEEIKALIGILYISGVMKSAHLNTKDIWAKDGTGTDIVICTMSRKRFHFLMNCLRFDDKSTRNKRKQHDKITHIREIFEAFKTNSQSTYTVSENVTIDENLEAFRGRCSFRVFMKSKPAKYGLKIFMLTDSQSFFTYNMEIYCGTQPDGPYTINNAACEVVKRLVTPISQTGRNITVDNWFTSIPLAQDLLQHYRLTLVGTVRKNKREIPTEFVQVKDKPICSSTFGFSKDKMTLVSYIPKRNKCVVLLSTMHYSPDIDPQTGEALKPEIITYYNKTKIGVDVVDQMCQNYSISRRSNRWPLTVFYFLLNVGGINAQIILEENLGRRIPRRDFLKELGRNLLDDYLRRRATNNTLPKPLQAKIKHLTEPVEEVGPQAIRKGGRCHFCPRAKDRKTTKCCANCGKPICKEHVVESCLDCFTVE